ncbi:MAG TPA: DUF6152 family protein [Gammaproteobacteria bacterium]|jgi:hypothetical protein
MKARGTPLRSGIAAAVLPLALLLARPALGHHSFAVHFVGDELVTVTGVVTEFTFRNPHGLVMLDETRDDGTIVHWRIETNSPNILRRRGWAPDSVKAGDEVTIEGYPARDGSSSMRVARLIFADGRELTGQRPPPPGSADPD